MKSQERRRQHGKAIEYYARFTELWKDADPELQPQVSRAQQFIDALMRDRPSG